jgi:hypothetical protein
MDHPTMWKDKIKKTGKFTDKNMHISKAVTGTFFRTAKMFGSLGCLVGHRLINQTVHRS